MNPLLRITCTVYGHTNCWSGIEVDLTHLGAPILSTTVRLPSLEEPNCLVIPISGLAHNNNKSTHGQMFDPAGFRKTDLIA